MQLKMFVVPIKNVSEAEAEMNGFLRGHRVLAVQNQDTDHVNTTRSYP